MIITAPPLEEETFWPTLGFAVAAWMEANLVYGPGDLLGLPLKLDDEKKLLLARMYEVWPHDAPDFYGQSLRGRRRFYRCAISLQKGSAKTEFAALIAAAELHPDAPVRCYGFDKRGNPKGRGVTDPYIPMVAYTEEQSDELAYSALKVILEKSHVAEDFDIGIERIIRRGGNGKAVSLASAPDARDGARTTFQVLDETHRWTLPRLRAAQKTMMANLPKRKIANAWSLEITTAFSPGEGSVAEDTMNYALSVIEGKRADATLFFFHRQASDGYDMTKPEQARAAITEAAGPTAAWKDIDRIAEQWQDPTSDLAYLERTYLNRPVQASAQAFDLPRWRELGEPGREIPEGALVTLGFDGSRTHDATAVVATEVATGFQQLVGLWERPLSVAAGRLEDDWEVPEAEVDQVVVASFERWNVWRMYADPPYWEGPIAQWRGRYGDKRVIEWRTNRLRQTAESLRAYTIAMAMGELSHDGNADFARHIGNACRREINMTDERGRLFIIRKEKPDSPKKIDAAMAGALAWEARNDAIAAGMLHPPPGGVSLYVPGEEGKDERFANARKEQAEAVTT